MRAHPEERKEKEFATVARWTRVRITRLKACPPITSWNHPWCDSFPEKTLTEEQSNANQDIIVGEVISYEEEDTTPKLLNSLLERGVLLIPCVEKTDNKWLVEKVPKLSEDASVLKVVLARVMFRTELLVWVHKCLWKLQLQQILNMMKTQNKGLRTQNWRVDDRTLEEQVQLWY